MSEAKASQRPLGLRTIMELFDIGPGVAISALALSVAIVLASILYFLHSAPPNRILISSGPEGSVSERYAQSYARILKRNGVDLQLVSSKGSEENLGRLAEKSSRFDVGFVQSGTANPAADHLVSLGNIAYQPLLVFYRGKPLELLSDLKGKKVSIGPDGSGVRDVAQALLTANGVDAHSAELFDLKADEAAKAILTGKIDAAFLMSESASLPILKKLVNAKGIRLFSFKQAKAISRKMDHLHILELPEGTIDLGANIPSQDVTLVGPTVELIARKSLHPALSDLLLEAMVETHSKPGVFQKRGEFPNPDEHAFKLSEDAARYYKSGKSLVYRYLPFWLASLLSRILFAFVPTLVVLIPLMKSVPAFLRWRVNLRIHRHYAELLELEKCYVKESDPEKQSHLRQEFDRIEARVNGDRIRPAFAEQFYGLRGHINYVRDLVSKPR